MKIEIEDLMVGDEFLSPSNGTMKYLKVLVAPKQHPTRVHYQTKLPMYKSVRCAVAADVTTKPGWGGKMRQATIYHFRDYDLNEKISINLNYRDLWLVKRNTI